MLRIRNALVALPLALSLFGSAGCDRVDPAGKHVNPEVPEVGKNYVWEGSVTGVAILITPASGSPRSDLRVSTSFVARSSMFGLVLTPETSRDGFEGREMSPDFRWRVHGTLGENKRIVASRIQRLGAWEPDDRSEQLAKALYAGEVATARDALSNKADPNTMVQGSPALLELWGKGWIDNERRYQLAEMLVRAGHNVNASNRDGISALHTASRFHETRLVQLLLESGADPNLVASGTPETVLGHALHLGSPDGSGARPAQLQVVAMLLSKGARLSPRDTERGYAARLERARATEPAVAPRP